MLSHNIATVAELKTIEKEAKKEVEDALEKAKQSPQPDPSELYVHIWVKSYGADRKEVVVKLP